MDKATYDALVDGVEKWRKNSKVKYKWQAKIYSDSCTLCGLFAYEEDGVFGWCVGCPVYEATGMRECECSPWGTAYDAYLGGTLSSFRAAAEKEANFLAALVPAGGPTE